jgi:hypothetical protein
MVSWNLAVVVTTLTSLITTTYGNRMMTHHTSGIVYRFILPTVQKVLTGFAELDGFEFGQPPPPHRKIFHPPGNTRIFARCFHFLLSFPPYSAILPFYLSYSFYLCSFSLYQLSFCSLSFSVHLTPNPQLALSPPPPNVFFLFLHYLDAHTTFVKMLIFMYGSSPPPGL